MIVLCFLLLLHKHHVCTAIEENISRSLGETYYDKSVDFGVKSTSTANDDFLSEISYEKSLSSKNYMMNWTREELTDLLEQHGYSVKKGSEGWPLGMIGDIAYDPVELLPEMGVLHNRRNLMTTKKLWVDGGKAVEIPYYYDSGTKADESVFENAVKTWSDNTCLKFKKLAKQQCSVDLGTAAVCVGDFGGCFSSLGRVYSDQRRTSQQMSVMPNGCELSAAVHEFGHALGLLHEMARADREKYIHVLYRNIDIDPGKLKDKDIIQLWFQGSQCTPEQTYDLPKPYDPMSVMHYGSASFAKADQRPVYIHKNPHYQYMFDYHRNGGYLLTHYDKYIINLGYQCIADWKKSCQDSGKSVAKCQNYGYIGKDCKCACPNGFSGSTCGTKDGPLFPVQDRAKAMLDITEPGLVDMKGKGMHDENHNYPLEDFLKYQYITVVIRSGDETRISVDVAQNFETVKESFAGSTDYWMGADGSWECRNGLHVYVGSSEAGLMRVACISSMVNNELPEYQTMFRSKNNSLDIIGFGSWAMCYFGGPIYTRLAMEFQFNIAFLDKPEDNLSIKQKNPGKVGEAVDKAVKNVKKTLKALKASKVPIIIGVAVILVLLAAGGAGGAYWWYTRTADGEPKSLKDLIEEHSSEEDTSDTD